MCALVVLLCDDPHESLALRPQRLSAVVWSPVETGLTPASSGVSSSDS